MTVDDLPDVWRNRAMDLERFAPSAAAAFRALADELEATLAAGESELLTMPEAVAYSGYSSDHLTQLVREGKLTNYGRKHAPRYKAAELPTKARTTGGRRGLSLHRAPDNLLGATPRQAAAAIARR